MNSPESNKLIASSSSSDSPVVQESPLFNYLCNLSPIKPVKAAHVAQGFPELSIPTPPPVFTSLRLNPHPETNFLKRSKYSHSSNAALSLEHEHRRNTVAVGSDISERSSRKLMVGIVPCIRKACDSKDSVQVQPSSPSGCVDEYLADSVEVGCDSSDSANLCLNQADDAPEALQSGCIRSKETTVLAFNAGDKMLKNMEGETDVQIISSVGTEENLQGNTLAVVEAENHKGERQSVEHPDLISEDIKDINSSDFSHQPPSAAQSFTHLDTQSGEGEQEGKSDKNPQVLPENLLIDEHAVLSNESIENKIGDLEEAGQHQRGTRRRCLQFEASEARRKFISTNCGFSSPAIITRCSSVTANPTNLEILGSSQSDLATPSNNCTVNSSHLMPSKLSLVSAKRLDTHVDRSVRNGGKSSIRGPLPSGIGLHLNSIVNTAAMVCPSSSSINSTEDDYPSVQREKSSSVLVAENSPTSPVPYDDADGIQEFNQMSPTKKRQVIFCLFHYLTLSDFPFGYCECFAAGIYCAEPCACQGCFNKPEYEDMVLGTRQQIETRNPLAFAPKIVRRVTASPANSGEDTNKVTPASARHKRGCNCKKSMCLKKYCECFQSGVGCSAGCRCEGCKNSFGIKEGYNEIRDMISTKLDRDSWEDRSEGKLVMGNRRDVIHPEHCHPHNLTPVTPSFQHSNHGRDVPKSRFLGRCLPSPESDTRSPGNLKPHSTRSTTGEGRLDIGFGQEFEYSVTGRLNFSPRWDGLEDIYNLTPLAQPPMNSTDISSPSHSRECAKVSQVQLQGSVRLSGSLCWRTSPITPRPQLSGSKLCHESDSDIGYEILEDDTPDILKDTHTPIKAVKASSPNQKRVSPPNTHLHSLRSSSSPGLRSGRKFVLQSISSFPSLTPYSDPKDSFVLLAAVEPNSFIFNKFQSWDVWPFPQDKTGGKPASGIVLFQVFCPKTDLISLSESIILDRKFLILLVRKLCS
ncbi:hypothetical protein IFM89_006329 [Coptis chinensis]|uniref:CRC domain-containing protein n=1 Tax=Coptis chinensis TaxID=261450 RepID=A0A835ICB0_9MAGN|nr:hypothetical protein IFM89_006329 [Coptis chinensis]